VLGDWEGTGPLGLRLSFEFVRRGRRVVVADYALGLPTGCRSTGTATWDAAALAHVGYIAPGQALRRSSRPLGPRRFEFILPPTSKRPFPVTMAGTFSNARHGVVSIVSPTRRGCAHTAWPRTLRFSLSAAQRVAVGDGLWVGTVAGPPIGTTGAVKIRVIDGGRIETDFWASYQCPPSIGGGGSFEIGPLPSVGYLIAADGSIGGARGTETSWRGRFSGGVLSGQLEAANCGSSAVYPTFTARLMPP
jgi:hypothetical protein